MAILNIFSRPVADQVIQRIEKLTPSTQPLWGKMNVTQMLAHCNVTYETVFTSKHPKPNFFMNIIFKLFVKKVVVGEKPYPRNSQTAPIFIIGDDRNFEMEKKRLIDHINQVQQLGEAHFDGLQSLSFGALTKTEWNNLFYKHLEHHLGQFGV